MKQLFLVIIILCCVNFLWNEHRKTLIIPGNSVTYKGEIHEIAALVMNTITKARTVKLDSLSGKMLSADSVKNNYRPFWERIN